MSNRRSARLLSFFAALMVSTAESETAVADQRMCKPLLAIQDVQASSWQPPSMERRWTATVTIDATPCRTGSSGAFTVGFLRAKENAIDQEFRQSFEWRAHQVPIAVTLWADEAIEASWIDSVSPCPCGDR
jgi:hypothetical protein